MYFSILQRNFSGYLIVGSLDFAEFLKDVSNYSAESLLCLIVLSLIDRFLEAEGP